MASSVKFQRPTVAWLIDAQHAGPHSGVKSAGEHEGEDSYPLARSDSDSEPAAEPSRRLYGEPLVTATGGYEDAARPTVEDGQVVDPLKSVIEAMPPNADRGSQSKAAAYAAARSSATATPHCWPTSRGCTTWPATGRCS